MTSKFVPELVGSRPPLNEGRRVQPQDSQRGSLVRLPADITSPPGMSPQTLDGMRQPFVKGQRPETMIVANVGANSSTSVMQGIDFATI